MRTPSYAITLTPAAQRALRRIDRPTQTRLLAAVERLRADPRPHGATTLHGMSGLMRIRVGDYRVLYTVRDERLSVLVVTIGHRGEVYRRL